MKMQYYVQKIFLLNYMKLVSKKNEIDNKKNIKINEFSIEFINDNNNNILINRKYILNIIKLVNALMNIKNKFENIISR